MKKTLFFLTFFLTAMFAHAEATLTLDEGLKVKPGETFTVNVNLANENAVSGIEMKISLPNGLTFVGMEEEGEMYYGEATDRSSASFAGTTLSGNTLTAAFLATGAKNRIKAGSGSILKLTIKAADNAPIGIGKIKLFGMEIAYPGASPENPADAEYECNIYNSFTVTATTANAEMGSVTGGGTYDSGSTATLTATPNEGFHFVKWSNEATENPYTFTVNAETSLTATFAPNQYTITFDSNGGTSVSDLTADYKAEITAPENPTKEGYNFGGWNPAFPETMPLNGAALTAIWTPISYQLTYDLAGGTVATENPVTYTIETETFTLVNPTREGYDFAGWTGTGLTEATKVVTVNKGSIGDRSYIATWTPITYNLTYELAGGSVTTENPVTYTIETETFTLVNPTREGYDFAGWTGTGLTEATKVVTVDKGSIGDRSYIATWTPVGYTVSYELAGGAVEAENPATYTIETETFTLVNPTREGYDFAGWTGTGLTVATKVVTVNKGSIGNRSYTATWTPITYNLTYELVGGSVATENPVTYTIETETFTLVNPTREGYDFAGWTGTGLTEATKVVTIDKGSIGDRSYTAIWTAVGFKLIYDLAGGNLPEGQTNPEGYNIESEAFTLVNPTREGYNFAGWTGTGLTEATITVTIAKGGTGDRSYTATWIPVGYTVSYELAGGAVEAENPATYTIETETFTLVNPTRDGYDFAGWTGTGLTEATKVVTVDKGSTGNRSYTATWTPVIYNLTYDLSGGSVETENPSTYTIETETFTLVNPTRDGYDFAGWTGTGLDEPTMTVAIEKGNTGDRNYTATWIINVTELNITVTEVEEGTAPTMTIKYGDKTLTEGIDYTVAYFDANNNEVLEEYMMLHSGTYTAVITLQGEYRGTFNKSIVITPATGINGIALEQKYGTGDWYTIKGQKLSRVPTAKGIYIINGKKVAVK